MSFDLLPGYFSQCCTWTYNEIIWASLWENRPIAYAKTKTQISFAVTAKLISAFVFATWIGQSPYFLNVKFQASSHLLWLYSPVCVGPGRKSQRQVFSQRGSFFNQIKYTLVLPTHLHWHWIICIHLMVLNNQKPPINNRIYAHQVYLMKLIGVLVPLGKVQA